MEDTSTFEAGTDLGQDGSPDLGGQTDPGESAIPLEGDGEGEGRSRGSDGKFAPAPEAERTLEELVEADPESWNQKERRKVIKAGRNGLKTQSDYDAKFGKAKTAGLPEEGEVAEELPAGQKPKPGTKEKGAAPAADLSFLKEALPTLDLTKPQEVVKSIKELQGHATRASQRSQQLETLYSEVETGIVDRLKRGPEGLKEMFTLMNVAVPEWLGKGNAPAQPAPAGSQPEMGDLLAGLKDDDFVPASAVKGMVGKLVSQAVAAALAQVDQKYAPLQQSHQAIQARIAQDVQAAEMKAVRDASLADADIHSQFWGEYHPEERLSKSAQAIWDASVERVNRNGKMVSLIKEKPDAEWPKLKAILEHRKLEYLDKGHKAASYEHYLYERFHKSGKAKEMTKSAEQRAQEALLKKQQQRVQPALVNRGVNGGAGLGGLRMPKSVEDVEAMTPQERRQFRQQASRGKLAVRT